MASSMLIGTSVSSAPALIVSLAPPLVANSPPLGPIVAALGSGPVPASEPPSTSDGQSQWPSVPWLHVRVPSAPDAHEQRSVTPSLHGD
jgi:hypothetical protein